MLVKLCSMKISNIYNNAVKPKLYDKGNAVMWTDEHISKQLLHVHLNSELDLGSRKKETIKSTVEWILAKTENRQLNILDLGCGPGLYTEKLAKRGHAVTGVDFSSNSIIYAKAQSKKQDLDIHYLCENYLKLNLNENTFDLVILIYTDFGTLLPKERESLLEVIKKALKPGGVLIFDVLNDKNLKNKTTPKSWETSIKGFWKNTPYLSLSESFLYENEKVILYQHIVIDEEDDINVYRFWTHYFSHADLTNILVKSGFRNLSFYEDVLPKGDLWNGDNVTFCKAVNSKN